MSDRDGFRPASAIERRSIAWLIGRRAQLARSPPLLAKGGAGKSTAAQAIAARVSRGQLGALPGGTDLTGPRGVVILTTEEDPEAVVMPRLAAMGADLDRIAIYGDDLEADQPLTLPSGAGRLADVARSFDAALVVVDVGAGLHGTPASTAMPPRTCGASIGRSRCSPASGGRSGRARSSRPPSRRGEEMRPAADTMAAALGRLSAMAGLRGLAGELPVRRGGSSDRTCAWPT